VGATRINHVSVQAVDLDESARFYEQVFGMERIPTAKFQGSVLWLKLGEQQLHLFERDAEAPRFHHFALDVDDFEAVYSRLKELGLLDSETHGAAIREHPTGWVQLYIRDPGGNLVEIDWPDASTLDRSIVTDIRSLDDEVPQTGDSAGATLYTADTGR
jgi:catechol 2,3-dioxygenase-like lactoylglutathione lyase family enzyme